MKELKSFGWYASRIAPHLPKNVFKPVPSRLWRGLVFLLIAIAGLLTISMVSLHPLIYLAIAIVIGLNFASLGFLGHEILHGTVVKKAWLRNFLEQLLFGRSQQDRDCGEDGTI